MVIQTYILIGLVLILAGFLFGMTRVGKAFGIYDCCCVFVQSELSLLNFERLHFLVIIEWSDTRGYGHITMKLVYVLGSLRQ